MNQAPQTRILPSPVDNSVFNSFDFMSRGFYVALHRKYLQDLRFMQLTQRPFGSMS